AHAWGKIEAPGRQNDPLAAVLLQYVPGGIRLLGELHVSGRVIRQANDARVVLRFSPHVPQLELFQPEHVGTRLAGEPVRGSAAQATQAQDDVLIVPADHAGKMSPRCSRM